MIVCVMVLLRQENFFFRLSSERYSLASVCTSSVTVQTTKQPTRPKEVKAYILLKRTMSSSTYNSSDTTSSNTSQNNNATLPGIEDELQRLVVTNEVNHNDVGSSFQRLLSMISSLQYLDDDDSTSNRMNHYSIIPIELQKIYDTIHQQTTLIHNTVTKYTLMQQMVVPNNNNTTDDTTTNTIMTPITNELLQSCCILVACMMTIHNSNNNNNDIGCSKSVFRHTKTAIMNLLHAVIQLVDSFSTTTTGTRNIDPAQRTGVVWEACQTIIGNVVSTTTSPPTTTSNNTNPNNNNNIMMNQKRKEMMMMISTLPLGNRNAIRRDLLNFKLECQDTIQEFELLISESTIHLSTTHSKNTTTKQKKQYDDSIDDDDDDDDDNDEDDDDDDEEDFYTTPQEIRIVTPCVALLKCSRGALNITLNMMDHIGTSIVSTTNNHTNNNNDVITNQQKYIWIQYMYDEIYLIGRKVTELGATLYPPLQDVDFIAMIAMEVIQQSTAIQNLLQYMLDEIIVPVTSSSTSITIPTATIDLIHSVQSACEQRAKEALDAIQSV